MAGTDDRPDDEGPEPSPDDDSGPDDGPTPDDADPPGPDDEEDPPGEGRPDRREGRSRLELVAVGLTAIAFIVGSVFSYLSVVASMDSVVIARQALNDSRQAEEGETLKDLAQITFDVWPEDDRVIIQIRNGSSRPFEPTALISVYSADRLQRPERQQLAVISYMVYGLDTHPIESCALREMFVDSQRNPEYVAREKSRLAWERTLVGLDTITGQVYGLEKRAGPSLVGGSLDRYTAGSTVVRDAPSIIRVGDTRIENC